MLKWKWGVDWNTICHWKHVRLADADLVQRALEPVLIRIRLARIRLGGKRLDASLREPLPVHQYKYVYTYIYIYCICIYIYL